MQDRGRSTNKQCSTKDLLWQRCDLVCKHSSFLTMLKQGFTSL